MYLGSRMRGNIKIVLVPGFSYLSLGSILEPLHTLNKLYPDLLVNYELISITDKPVMSESGIKIDCQNYLGNLTLKPLKG